MKKIKLVFLTILGIIIVSGTTLSITKLLSNLDVIAKDSVRSFGEVIEIIVPNTTEIDWELVAPDSEAAFIWNSESAGLWINITPFITAGLDISTFNNISDNNMFIRTVFNNNEQGGEQVKNTPLIDYEKIVHTSRNSIGFHTEMNHYNINLGNGNMFEWTKDFATNDKDIMFVLNPEPFINAGVNPTDVAGWTYTTVSMMHEGRNVETYKFLKNFDIK